MHAAPADPRHRPPGRNCDRGRDRPRRCPPPLHAAIVTAIGNGAPFHKGREFAAWMGLVPKQYSTGGKAKLAGISKRGNLYLRKILIHGARAVVLRSKQERIATGA